MTDDPDRRTATAGQSALSRLAAALAALSGWRCWLSAWLAGLFSALALPPVGFVPALFVAFPVLAWQIDGARRTREAFVLGWLFGFGHFMAGIWWVHKAFPVEAGGVAWMVPVATVGLPAALALYPAAACALVRSVRPGWPRIAALAIAWTAFEMLRGVGHVAFPWNPVGSVWSGVPAMMQPAAAVGVHGLTLLTVALAAAPALIAAGGRRAVAAAVVAPLALALVWWAGAQRLAGAEAAVHPGVRIGVVQADIPHNEKTMSAAMERHLVKHLDMTARAAAAGATHILWPETSLTDMRSNVPRVARAVPEGGLVIVGATRATAREVRPFRIWNSLVAIDGEARRLATYDKARLVPFAEYVPLRPYLSFAQAMGAGMDFSRGSGVRTLRLPGLPPFSPLICYEIVFSGQVVDRRPDGRRAEWIANITNDGWFDGTPGPHQHFAAARMRAVEEGVPVVRAANTGISATIDPWGRPVERLGPGRNGTFVAALPAALPRGTIFARFGYAPLLAFMAFAAAVLAAGRIADRPAIRKGP